MMSSDFSDTTAMTPYQVLRLTKKPFLVVMTGKDIAHRYPLTKDEITIGRALDVDIVLEDSRASRQHARISTSEQGAKLQDLKSTNGTYVNNQKIDHWSLMDGDLIAIGNTLLKFSFQSEVEGEYHDGMVDSVKTDGLTGLLNRRFFDKQLELELTRARRMNNTLGFILCDLDNFKNINDGFGHQVGDLVLKRVSSTIKDQIRETDFAGRYGGEELCVLLPNTDLEGTREVAEKIRSTVEQLEINQEQGGLKVTVSIGVSTLGGQTNTAEALVQRADKNLYQAKAKGKNQIIG